MSIEIKAERKVHYVENLNKAIKSSYALVDGRVNVKDSFKRINNLLKLIEFDENLKSRLYEPLKINPYSGFPSEHIINEFIRDVKLANRISFQSNNGDEYLQLLKHFMTDNGKDLNFLRKSYAEKKYYSNIQSLDAKKNFLNSIPEFLMEENYILITDFLDDCWEITEVNYRGQVPEELGSLFEDRYNLFRPRTTKQLANKLITDFNIVPLVIMKFQIGPFYFSGNKDYSAVPEINQIMNGDPQSYALTFTFDRLRTLEDDEKDERHFNLEQKGMVTVKQTVPKKYLIVSPDVSMNLNKKVVREFDYIIGEQNEQRTT